MAENINIQKTVFNRNEFDRVIDREFKTFVPPTDISDPDTIDELFRLYNKFYLELKLRGGTNSHEYLIRRSSELVDLSADDDRLQPLLDEITNLRTQLVDAQEQILELEIAAATNVNG